MLKVWDYLMPETLLKKINNKINNENAIKIDCSEVVKFNFETKASEFDGYDNFFNINLPFCPMYMNIGIKGKDNNVSGVLIDNIYTEKYEDYFLFRCFVIIGNSKTIDYLIPVIYKVINYVPFGFHLLETDLITPAKNSNYDPNEPMNGFITGIFNHLFTAIMFMNCKNISLIEVDPNQRLKQSVVKHMNKKGMKPLTKYYTLDIDPMKHVLRKEGCIEKNGVKKAFHVCRGHFKKYEGKGLFGKYPGTYWIPQHMKGSNLEGAIVKDYNIKTIEGDLK